MKTTMCLHQVFRSDIRLSFTRDGCGNCFDCVLDKKNKECPDYYPITIWEFQVKEENNVSLPIP